MTEESDLHVEPMDEYDVDVRETLERKLEEYGIDASISEYEQPMLVATTRRKVGDDTWSSYKIEMPANVICTQEELDEMIDERIDELVSE